MLMDVFSRMQEKTLRVWRPEYYFESSQAFGRSFKIRLFIPKGEAKILFTYQPDLYDSVIDHWDRLKAAKTQSS
jgi:hypothetical protein